MTLLAMYTGVYIRPLVIPLQTLPTSPILSNPEDTNNRSRFSSTDQEYPSYHILDKGQSVLACNSPEQVIDE